MDVQVEVASDTDFISIILMHLYHVAAFLYISSELFMGE